MKIQLDQEEYVDIKEKIASVIFDFDSEDYVRPDEEDCHAIAEEIMDVFGLEWI
jgi:hypothetical protein